MASFNQRLKHLRLSKKLSREVLAHAIGVSKSSINMYERGEREPSLETLEAIADYFNVDMNYLLGKTAVTNELLVTSSLDPLHTLDPVSSAELSKKINDLRKKHNLTLEQVASVVGVGKSTVRKWETGLIQNMRSDKIALLAKALHTSPAYLMGWTDSSSPVPTTEQSGARIPVYGSVAAGIPIEAITDIEDYEEIPEDIARTGQFIALRIRGASMEPRFTDGDVVIVKLQEDVENGDIAVVFVNGYEATCKKIKKTPEGVMLISTNPAYEPMFYSNKEIEEKPVRIWGKVVELRAKF